MLKLMKLVVEHEPLFTALVVVVFALALVGQIEGAAL